MQKSVRRHHRFSNGQLGPCLARSNMRDRDSQQSGKHLGASAVEVVGRLHWCWHGGKRLGDGERYRRFVVLESPQVCSTSLLRPSCSAILHPRPTASGLVGG